MAAPSTELRLTVPLRQAWLSEPPAKRPGRAVRALAVAIQQRTEAGSVSLSARLNDAMWKRARPPARVTVLVTVSEGVAAARLADEQAAQTKAKPEPATAPATKAPGAAAAGPPEPAGARTAPATKPEQVAAT